MKLSKKQLAELRSIFNDLTKAETFIYSDSTVIAVKATVAVMPEDTYVNKNTGEKVAAINKHCGSPVNYFSNGLGKLNHFLNTNQ